ncbi:hypothetical protein [Massilia sp. TS11]|uniref:hypothetical protein n=1 Tax=Massilia sp. TS11 TaxID=2908003 RepID=UPI001EDC389D|nr:hypothetical protein [Massilia sp. TS11]MCG2584529.1 hypothetical protein [Massilia sp. TS11]
MPTYVQHEVLGKVPDVFSAEALWQAPGLALFQRRPLLRELLERCPRETRGRQATRCFTHICVGLPHEAVEDDRHLQRGARARELAAALSALHQQDFGDLLGGESVRYTVQAEALAPDQVAVRFGHAVYVAGAQDSVLYQLSVSRDGSRWQALGPIYAEQRLCLLGSERAQASHVVADWPFAPEDALLIVNEGPDSAPELQMRPRSGYSCTHDPAHDWHVVTARRGSLPARLLVRLQPAAAPAAAARVWQARAGATVLAAAPAALPGAEATFAPAAGYSLQLAALALPRLAAYPAVQASALTLALDAQLRPVRGRGALCLRVAADGALSLQAKDQPAQALTLPGACTLPSGASLRVLAVPPALGDRYAALLPLAGGASLPLLSGARLPFGRQAGAVGNLRVAAGALTLEGDDAAQAERLGLSRQACSLEAGPDGLLVRRLAPQQALYHLGPDLGLVAVLPPGEAPYCLPWGHHLLAGPYLLLAQG